MMSRRVFLAGAGSVAVLAACGGSDTPSGSASGTASPGPKSAGGRVLGAGFADGFSAPSVLVAGLAQRLPLVVFDADGSPVREGGPDSFEVAVLRNNAIVATSTVTRHSSGIPTPYYPLTFTPTEAGDYEARAAFSSRAMPFKVATRDTVKLVQVGDPLRPVATPTLTDARGVNPICTRSPKPCPFHTTTLTDAIAARKPTVFVVSTPGFCQTAICGPVLELLIDLAPGLPRFQFIHAEVYVEPNKKISGAPKTTDAVSVYGLQYEPSLFVADADAIVRARLDFSWDRAELDAALAQVR